MPSHAQTPPSARSLHPASRGDHRTYSHRHRHHARAHPRIIPAPANGAPVDGVSIRAGVPMFAPGLDIAERASRAPRREVMRRPGRRITRSRSTPTTTTADPDPDAEEVATGQRPMRHSRVDVDYYEGGVESSGSGSGSGSGSNDDDDSISVGDDVQFSVMLGTENYNARLARRHGFVATEIVPPQDHDPSNECDGTWLPSAPGEWRLADNLTEMEILSVQMRLGAMERRPSPSPPPSLTHLQQQQQMLRSPPPPPSRRRPDTPRDTKRELPKCRVCLDAYTDVVFRNCGHMCVCTGCRDKLAEIAHTGWIRCPVCRVDGDTISVFV